MIAMRELNHTFVTQTDAVIMQHNNVDQLTSANPLTSHSSALTKRCVIIQKDERGYGLRVSGDNPVFVESVRKEGAAWKAGVRSGDRIIKVNGTLVTRHGHGDVVRMIQNCGSYVGLTLLGLKNSPNDCVSPTQQSIQITSPLPASESTQQQYEESRMATIREMIRREKEHLDKVSRGKNCNQMEMEKTVKSIQQLEMTLEKMSLDETNKHRHSMSAENLTTGTSADASLIAAMNARKSHSFGQYDTRAPIMTMESDDDSDDLKANQHNHHNNSAVNTVSAHACEIPLNVDSLHGHSLQMSRWLISQQCPPHALLFNTMAGHVFPSLVNSTNSRRSLQRMAWQIACTWLVPDSPLAFTEFPAETLTTFDATLVSAQSSLETLFEPFIEATRDILSQQLEAWRSAAVIGLAPQTMPTPKEELQSTIELLLNETQMVSMETAVDNMIAHAHVNNVSTIAVVTSLLTIGHYVFACPSKHLLLSHADASSSPPLNPVLKLSIDHSSSSSSGSSSNKRHKRAVSCPTRPLSAGHLENGHHFGQTNELTKLLYCSGCLLPIWGTFGQQCSHCQMSVHVWCMKNAAANSPCPGPQSDNAANDATPARGKKNRRWNSDKYTILDRIKKSVAHTHEPQPLISSTSSSDDDEDDHVISTAIPSPLVTADTTANSTTPTPPNTIGRSESFRQRRKTVPSYRKRSDPALTTASHNTTLATTTSNDSALTPDLSGSPTTTSPDNWISSSDDDEDDDECVLHHVSPPVVSGGHVDEDTPPPLPPRPPSEKRKQIYNEIIDTEERHVEVLNFIYNVFYRPLKEEKLLKKEELLLVFCNTKRLRRIHRNICKTLKVENKSIERSLCDIFCGELGHQLEVEVSIFCTNQSLGGLDTWRARKKDSKIKYFTDPEIRTKEMPDSSLARLQLEDHLGTVFQRPLRYPILLDRLLKATPTDSVEYGYVCKALEKSRDIGVKVNEATRRALSRQRLNEIMRKCDKTQGLSLNLEDHNLVYEGALTWRITKQKCVDVWLLLTDKILVILLRESGDRFVLKYYNNPAVKSSSQLTNQKAQHHPIVLLHDLLTRDVATDQTAFFLISTDQDIFYEFAAATPKERNVWKEQIANVTLTYNKCGQQMTKLRDLTSQQNCAEVTEVKAVTQTCSDDVVSEVDTVDIVDNREGAEVDSSEAVLSDDHNSAQPPPPQPETHSSRVEGVIRYVREDEVNAPELISPSSITVSNEVLVSEALAVQSPQQQIGEIDCKVGELLGKKRSILAQMHGIRDQWEWSVVCDLSEHDQTSHELTFFDKAMSLVSNLATNGLTADAYQPLLGLRDQIDALLARVSAHVQQEVEAPTPEEQNLFFQASDQSSEETAVYF